MPRKKPAQSEMHPIEKALMGVYLAGAENNSQSCAPQGMKKANPAKTKIPGVRQADGSPCCGGGCCVDSAETAQKTWNKKQYLDLLNQVLDPETFVGIVDMGLIYDIEEKDGLVNVTMTLTSMGCPAGGQITTEIDSMLRLQKHVHDVKIDVVWDPPWNLDMMNPEVRVMLFGR